MPPLELSSHITVVPEYCDIAKAQNNNIKIASMNMTEVLKKEMNESIKEIFENTNKQQKEMNKLVQDPKVEMESTKKPKLREI